MKGKLNVRSDKVEESVEFTEGSATPETLMRIIDSKGRELLHVKSTDGIEITVEEINALLQEAANKDMEDVVVDGPVPVDVTGLEPDVEGWDEYVARTLAGDPPADDDEEEV